MPILTELRWLMAAKLIKLALTLVEREAPLTTLNAFIALSSNSIRELVPDPLVGSTAQK